MEKNNLIVLSRPLILPPSKDPKGAREWRVLYTDKGRWRTDRHLSFATAQVRARQVERWIMKPKNC